MVQRQTSPILFDTFINSDVLFLTIYLIVLNAIDGEAIARCLPNGNFWCTYDKSLLFSNRMKFLADYIPSRRLIQPCKSSYSHHHIYICRFHVDKLRHIFGDQQSHDIFWNFHCSWFRYNLLRKKYIVTKVYRTRFIIYAW